MSPECCSVHTEGITGIELVLSKLTSPLYASFLDVPPAGEWWLAMVQGRKTQQTKHSFIIMVHGHAISRKCGPEPRPTRWLSVLIKTSSITFVMSRNKRQVRGETGCVRAFLLNTICTELGLNKGFFLTSFSFSLRLNVFRSRMGMLESNGTWRWQHTVCSQYCSIEACVLSSPVWSLQEERRQIPC